MGEEITTGQADAGGRSFQQTLYCKEDALTAEADLRIYFESHGYRVAGGTERLDARRKALGIT